jgi:hypothetical protein
VVILTLPTTHKKDNTMIGKKEKLSDVYAKGAFSPYLTSIGPFKDVYPSISKLNVEVRQSSTLTGSTPWV